MSYRITYVDGSSETVNAERYLDPTGEWIEFVDRTGSQLLRVRWADVVRVERR